MVARLDIHYNSCSLTPTDMSDTEEASMTSKTVSDRITVRIPADMQVRLDKMIRSKRAYTPTITDIVVRGIVLALRELERSK